MHFLVSIGNFDLSRSHRWLFQPLNYFPSIRCSKFQIKFHNKRFNVDARTFDNVKYTSQRGRLILDNGVPHFLQHCARPAGDTCPTLCTESRIQKSRQRNDGRGSTSWRSSQLLLFFTFTNRCQCQCLRSPCAFVPRIMVIASRNDRAIRSLVAEIDAHHAG